VNEQHQIQISKFLSKYLRHEPEALGLELQPGGWVFVEELLAACNRSGMPLTREQLEEVVQNNDKQRFSLDEGETRIRANQGHSTPVDLQLEPGEPPAVLYHGTPEKFSAAVDREGLKKMERHHVHLSPDEATALKLGARRGRPVVYVVDAAAMRRDGHTFYRSENGVWLVDRVPPEYLHRVPRAGAR